MNDQNDPNTRHPRKSRSDTTPVMLSPKQALFNQQTRNIRSAFCQLNHAVDPEILAQYKRFCTDMIHDFSVELCLVDDRVKDEREDELEKLREKLSKVNALLSE